MEDEVAIYDALATNESAVQAMGNSELNVIATELVSRVRNSVTIDWTVRESARARIKVMVKKILRKYGLPPDLTMKPPGMYWHRRRYYVRDGFSQINLSQKALRIPK
jgi:Domain of unknown function (DUF3387)